MHADSEDAIANLAARENIDEKNRPSIHGVHRDGSRVGSVSTGVAPRVHAWLVEQPDLNAAIWTGLGAGSRWPEHGFPDGLSADNAILYIQSLRKTPDHPAFKYLRNAPDQVRTPVRQRAQTEGIV